MERGKVYHTKQGRERNTNTFKTSIKSRTIALESSGVNVADGTVFESMPFELPGASLLSSRFRFAERGKEELVESGCGGGLKIPLREAITRLAVLRDRYLSLYFAVRRDSR
jgi:hypothetical protein